LRRASSSPSDPNASDSSQPGDDRPTLQHRDSN